MPNYINPAVSPREFDKLSQTISQQFRHQAHVISQLQERVARLERAALERSIEPTPLPDGDGDDD